MDHGYKTNLCTSEIMNKRDSEKCSTKYTHKLVAFDPGNAGYGVSDSLSFKNFLGEVCPGLPYIIRAFGADNPLASPVTCYKIRYGLIFSFKRTPYLDKANDDTESA